jgi:flavin-dependent trigonelline monooxygenase, reductase component
MTSSDHLDVSEFRKALGRFVTGVTVVTTLAPDGAPRGFTANSFTSVSLRPPLILVCIARSAASHNIYESAASFAVSILSQDQQSISSTFASSRPDKFADIDWSLSANGCPIIGSSAAWLDCIKHDMIEAGDHTILIGRVEQFSHSARMPLGYYQGRYVALHDASLAQSGG